MKSRNILVVALIIIILGFYYMNSPSVYTIDDSAYVIGMGIDSANNGKIKLSLQIAIPTSESSSSSSGGSSQSSSSIVNTVECNTIDSGINLINSYMSKKLDLAYCKVVVFSEEMASKGIVNYACTLINDIEVRPYCNILISRCDAKYYLENSKPMLDDLSSKYYDIEDVSEKNTGLTKSITLLDFYNDYYDTFGEPCAILGSINGANAEQIENNFGTNTSNNSFNINSLSGNTQSSNNTNENIDSELPTTTQKNIENLGLAVFHNGNFVGELSGSETIYHMMVTNNFKSAVISIPSPFEDSDYISLSLSNVKSNNKVKIVNGFPYITCNVSIDARVLSTSSSSNYLSKNNISNIEEYANSYFKAHIQDYLYKTSVSLNADINKFGKYAVKNFSTWNEWASYDWINKYENSIFKVEMNTSVKSSYLVVGIS